MYDPMTVICKIGNLTLWHRDPCSDGTDNSCYGLTKEEREKLTKVFKYDIGCIVDIFKTYRKGNELEVIYCAYRSAKYHLIGKRLKAKDYFYILDLCLNSWDNLTIYGDINDKKEDAMIFYLNVARIIKTFYRPWYKHARWHIHHWGLTINIGKKLFKFNFEE